MALALAVGVTSGCIAPRPTVKKKKTDGSVNVAGGASSDSRNNSDTGSAFKFANPGPFKLVTKDGEEMWQARGDLGRFGGTLHLSSFGGGPKTFNPWDASDVESHGIGMLQFDSLVDIDPWTGKPIPKIAREIKVSPDGKSVSFIIRKGLKWSDGKPLTADDVVFTFDEIVKKSLGEGSSKDTIATPDDYPQISKQGDDTVTFTFKETFSPFLANLNAVCIAPKHVLEPIAKAGNKEFKTFWNINTDPKTMAGCGPFILESYVPSQRITFRRNPHYAMVDKQGRRLPYLDKLVIGIVPRQETQIFQFLGKEVDFLDIRSVRGNDAGMLKAEEKKGDFKLYDLGPDDGTVFIMFNMARRVNPKTKKPYVDPIKSAWFNDANFRHAVSHAIDRKRIVSNVLKGIGYPLSTCETDAAVYANKSLQPIDYDLQKSRKLLADSGFVLKNNMLYDSTGHRVEFDLLTNAGNTVRDACCIMIKEELKKLGIKVNYQAIEFNAMINKVHTSLDWQSLVMGLSGSRFEPYSGANVWKSEGRMHMFDTRLPDKDGIVRVTDARPWEKEIDQCFINAARSMDEGVRRQNYERFQQIAYEQEPIIYLYANMLLPAMRNTVGNYKPTPYGLYYTPKGSLHNLEEIYFK